MEIFSYIVIILLSLAGYSAGAVIKAGKSVQLRPQIIDLFLIVIIWAGAIYTKIVLDWNRWLIVLLWIILSVLIGILAVWPRKLPEEKVSVIKTPAKATISLTGKIWQSWQEFSRRIGSFQSRMIISLFFFILISPFALTLKIFSDPLIVKYHGKETHWLVKISARNNVEQFKRQF